MITPNVIPQTKTNFQRLVSPHLQRLTTIGNIRRNTAPSEAPHTTPPHPPPCCSQHECKLNFRFLSHQKCVGRQNGRSHRVCLEFSLVTFFVSRQRKCQKPNKFRNEQTTGTDEYSWQQNKSGIECQPQT